MVIGLVDVSDIFYFFCSREGKGESEAPGGGGGRFFIENPRRRGGLPRGWGRGAGRVFAGNGGGGSKYFFSGAKFPPSRVLVEINFEASKTLYLKASQSLKIALTKARLVKHDW